MKCGCGPSELKRETREGSQRACVLLATQLPERVWVVVLQTFRSKAEFEG